MAEFRIEGVPAENNKSLCGGGHLRARAELNSFLNFCGYPLPRSDLVSRTLSRAPAPSQPPRAGTPPMSAPSFVVPIRYAAARRSREFVSALSAVATGSVSRGFMVRSALGSPAEHAGLRGVDFNTAALGDVIVAVNDKTVRRLSDLTNELERNGVGKTVPLTVQGAIGLGRKRRSSTSAASP
jgi:hypothetical protein